jgi:hypothetical protein
MATLLGLSGPGGPLFKLGALGLNEQEFRCLYLSLKLKLWMENELPALLATWQTELSCLEQVDALTSEFCAGETLSHGPQFHALKPISDGVWALKTGDIRIFGWFHTKDHFIGVVANEAYRIKLHDLYLGYVGEVARFRDGLDLNEPKFIPGDDPRAVVSNYDSP